MAHSPEIRDQALASYLAGASFQQVGEAMGISPNTVMRWVEKAGLASRPRSRKGRPNRQRTAVALEQQLSAYVGFTTALTQLQVDRSTLAEALRDGRIPGAFRWDGNWVIPRVGLAEYDRRRRERFPHLFKESG